MSGVLKALWSLSDDRSGQTTIEWALLLAFFAVPMVYVFGLLLSALAEHYRMVSFFETLPFP